MLSAFICTILHFHLQTDETPGIYIFSAGILSVSLNYFCVLTENNAMNVGYGCNIFYMLECA